MYELKAIVAEAGTDSRVPYGSLLTAFAEAVLTGRGDLGALQLIMRATLGDAGFVDACATIASFNAVVKIADGTGIPLEDWKETRTRDLRETLEIDAYRSGPADA